MSRRTSPKTTGGFTERLARSSASHPWRTIGIWAAVIVVAVLGMSRLPGSGLTSESKQRGGQPDSTIGLELVQDRMTGPQKMSEFVIVRSAAYTAGDAAYEAYVSELAGEIAGLGVGVVENVATYYQTKDPTLVSRDGHSMLVQVVMAGDLNTAIDQVDELHAVVAAGGRGDFTLQQTGTASLNRMGNELAKSDMEKTEVFGVPVALVVLVVVFGALLAAFMPLVLSILSIILALTLTALIGQLYPMHTFVLNILTTMGLAVGIDYTLFIISRYREERARGLEKIDAIAATGASANRAVFFSGMTVVLAMLGMVVVPMDLTISMGIGAMLVVFTTLLTSLILLPALMGLLGDRVNSLRVPFVSRFATRRADGHQGVWERLSHSIMRRPVIWLATAVTLLLLAASPILFMRTGSTGMTATGYPDDQYAKQGWDSLDRDFSLGKANPVQIVVDGRADAAAVKDGVAGLQAALEADGRFGPSQVAVSKAGDLTVLSAPLAGDPAGEETQNVIEHLRDRAVPAAFGAAATHVYVTGTTAGVVDYLGFFDRWLPIAMAVVLGLSFLLLLAGLPLDRDRGQGHPHEPAVGRRRLRPPRARLPEGRRRRPAGLHPGRRHRGLGAAVPLQPALRALHGLPGLSAHADQGALRPHRRHPRGRGPRHRSHRRHHHRRRGHHGLRLRRHGDGRARHVPADGLRPRRRHLPRRHGRADDHRAGRHGAARRLELVPAALARVAAGHQRRGAPPGGRRAVAGRGGRRARGRSRPYAPAARRGDARLQDAGARWRPGGPLELAPGGTSAPWRPGPAQAGSGRSSLPANGTDSPAWHAGWILMSGSSRRFEGEGVQILPVTTDHLAAILALNEEFVSVLAPLSRERLELLDSRASYHRVAADQDGVAGFVMAFGSEADHDSVNFDWFAARYRSFLYVDRVVVAAHRQGSGVGSLLYGDLFAFARRQGYEQVTCEIDADPPNPRSERFHDAFGFREVGSQQVEYSTDRPKRVSLRSARLDRDEP